MTNYLRNIMQSIRQKHGIPAKHLALSIEISPPYLSAIEQGYRKVPKDFFDKINSLLPLTETEQSELKNAIVIANGEEYFYEEIRKQLIKDMHELFTRINADTYERSVVNGMRKKLIDIDRKQRRHEQVAVAA